MARKNDRTKEIDVRIGQAIQSERMVVGLSRQQLADKIDVTHQQLQKYEKGTNRVSASRLELIAEALNKSISYFYHHKEEQNTEFRRLQLELSRNFSKLNSAHQQLVHNLVAGLVS